MSMKRSGIRRTAYTRKISKICLLFSVPLFPSIQYKKESTPSDALLTSTLLIGYICLFWKLLCPLQQVS